MSRNYNELLKIAYEIEGLLLMQSQRAADAVSAIDALIAEKIATLSAAFNDGACPDAPSTPTPQQECDVTPAPDSEAAANAAVAASAIAEEEMMASQPVSAPEPEVAAKPAPCVTPDSDTTIMNETIETPLSLDEKLARERARDIFRAFTLNDKFRFRRELFRNSQEEFDEALNIISQMSTIEEAQEYIYDDLCWDPANEDVKAFMDVVTKHF